MENIPRTGLSAHHLAKLQPPEQSKSVANVARRILESAVSVNAQLIQRGEDNPLFDAVYQRSLEDLTLGLNQIDPNIPNRFGTTPLFAALMDYERYEDPRSLGIIQTLAEKSDLTLTRNYGRQSLTPYEYAQSKGLPAQIQEWLKPR